MKLDKNWITGFVDGEGGFFVGINKNYTMRLGIQVLPEFVVIQHKRDIKILYALKEFFNCGIVKVNHGDRMCFCVRNVNHLLKIIIPFFEKNSLKTIKKFNFLRFRWIIHSMVIKKYHLNGVGLEKIILVKNKMNKDAIR